MSSKTRREQKPSGKCIFCGSEGVTDEHFWPEWAGDRLPRYAANERVTGQWTFTEKNKLVKPPKMQARQGQTWQKVLRVACQPCNNGWMSVLEEESKTFLLPMMTSQPQTLKPDAVRLLSRWIALKVMVGECSRPESTITPPEERARFMATGEMPSNFRIWLAKCGIGGWESSYVRHALLVETSEIKEVPNDGRVNTHTVAFGFGDIFILAFQTNSSGVYQTVNFDIDQNILALHPSEKEIHWPPGKGLTVAEATEFERSISNFFKGPQVQWRPTDY